MGQADAVGFLPQAVTKAKEADRAKTEFVSIASHELLTPLAGISWQVESLLSRDVGTINKAQNQILKNVQAATRNMIELIDALLSASRLELGTFIIEPVNVRIGDLVDEVVRDLSGHIKAKRLRVNMSVPKTLPKILADQKLTMMIIENVISNAVKYTPAGGKIRISLAQSNGREKMAGKRPSKGSLVFSVADTGYGIPRAEQEKMFTRMFRADNVRKLKIRGTGLGLYVVKSVLEAFGGSIWFESEENKGSTFCVEFPRAGTIKSKG